MRSPGDAIDSPPRFGRRRLLRGLAGLACGASAAGFAVTPFELRVIVWKPGDQIQQVLRLLERRYPNLQWSDDAARLARRPGPAVYLSLGPGALSAALAAALDGPLVSLFTSNEAYRRLITAQPPRAQRVTAIYAEASPLHQLQLIQRIFERRVRVGVLLSEVTAHLAPLVRNGASATGLDIDIQFVEVGDALRSLSRLRDANALLAMPDSSVYTAASLRIILEATYRREMPVVGFSPAMVSAGTMATVFSSIDDTLAQAVDVIDDVARGRSAEAQYPAYWRVAINDQVARSLNVVITEEVRTMGRRSP